MAQPVPKMFDVDHLPADALAGIGKVIAWWGYLQFQLGVIIRVATKLNRETGNALVMGQNFSPLFSMLRVLADSDHWIKSESIRRDIAKLEKDIKSKLRRRNAFAHGHFGFSNDNQAEAVRHLYGDAAHKVITGTESISPANLETAAEEARAFWHRAQDLTRRLRASR